MRFNETLLWLCDVVSLTISFLHITATEIFPDDGVNAPLGTDFLSETTRIFNIILFFSNFVSYQFCFLVFRDPILSSCADRIFHIFYKKTFIYFIEQTE